MQRTTAGKLWACAGAAVALATCIVGATMTKPAAETAPLASSLVRVDLYGGDKFVGDPIGHGSGVYIGNGIVITAAHVVDGHDKVSLLQDDGGKQTGEVLWANKTYDVAAVRVEIGGWLTPADLACVTPKRGDAIVAAGSPLEEDNVYVPGTIIGDARPNLDGKGKVVLTNAALGPGMSGGPAYDPDGHVVGINIAIQVADLGAHASGGTQHDVVATGINYLVPASVICELLARP
jgi:S1-C subfamily serine protease